MLTPIVLEILQFGLSGLVFLLAFLSFSLLSKEQKIKSPRATIVRAIYAFMVFSFSGAILVAVSAAQPAWLTGKSGDLRQTADDPIETRYPEATYSADYTSYLLDLSDWKTVPKECVKSERISKAKVTRTDMLRKLRSDADDYVVPYWTNGCAIDAEKLIAPLPPTFSEKNETSQAGRTGYELRIPLGSLPKGTVLPVSTEFTFWNGFQGTKSEDWRARISVPTRSLNVTFRFPSAKVVNSLVVTLLDAKETKVRELSRENPALIATDRKSATWSGLDVPGGHFVLFEFVWQDEPIRADGISKLTSES